MKDKLLILGDQAVALGALHAGISGVYAYPGTPSTEITEYIQSSPLGRGRGVYCDWCTNEKTAMEAALGVSFIGKRALVCMKHVGLNVAADAFVNSAMTGTHGGLVVLVADDPSVPNRVVSLLALLELNKRNALTLSQPEIFGTITIDAVEGARAFSAELDADGLSSDGTAVDEAEG